MICARLRDRHESWQHLAPHTEHVRNLGGPMRTLTGLATATVLFVFYPPSQVQAQIGEASSAFRAVVGEAQRLFRNRRSSRRKRFRSMIAADGSIIIPPQPTQNPRRSAAKSRPGGPARPLASTKAEKTKPSADKTTTTAAATRVEQPEPKPDVWTPAQIEHAARSCRKILGKVKAELEPVTPIKKGPCGTAAPFRLASLTAPRRVTFKPAPVLNCKMVVALDTWLRRGLQPLAKKHLGSPVVRVNVMSSYSCRNAYGRAKTRLSEHGLANAVDISAFVTANGEKTSLLADWGPTKRDLIAQAEKEKAQKEAEQRRLTERELTQRKSTLRQSQHPGITVTPPAHPAPKVIIRSQDGTNSLPELPRKTHARTRHGPSRLNTPSTTSGHEETNVLPPVPVRRPSLRERLQWAKAAKTKLAEQRDRESRAAYRKRLNKFLLTPRSNLGGPKPAAATGVSAKPKTKPAVDRAAFLRGAHRSACRIFGTVLGPEANDAHRNHFHVDLAYRRRSNYCR